MMKYVVAHFRDEVGIIIKVTAKLGNSTLEGVEIGGKKWNKIEFYKSSSKKHRIRILVPLQRPFSIKTSIHLVTKLKFGT